MIGLQKKQKPTEACSFCLPAAAILVLLVNLPMVTNVKKNKLNIAF